MYKKANQNFRLFSTALITCSLTFVSCQKDQDFESLMKDVGLIEVASKTASKSSDADKAFDKAVHQIMQDMMQQMSKMEMTCDPDIDFANMMIMHHEAGIKMADAELKYGHEPEAKELAVQTKEGNEASKQRLLTFLAAHPNPEPLSKEQCKLFMKEMDETMRMMMQCMKKAPDTEDVDVDFANQMICHHQGAIAMSRVELKWGNDEGALNEAKMIIEEQSKEIIELSEFINEHGIPSKKVDEPR